MTAPRSFIQQFLHADASVVGAVLQLQRKLRIPRIGSRRVVSPKSEFVGLEFLIAEKVQLKGNVLTEGDWWMRRLLTGASHCRVQTTVQIELC